MLTRVSVVSIVAALAVPTPCLAGPLLWRDVEAGMSVAKLQELYPAQKGTVHHKPKLTIIEGVQEVGRCRPDVHVEHPKGVVERVVIYSRYRGFPKESCGEEAAKALLGKYGSPQDEDEVRNKAGGVITSGLFKGTDTRRTERNTKQMWAREGLLVTFERWDPDVNDRWFITYEVQPDIGL